MCWAAHSTAFPFLLSKRSPTFSKQLPDQMLKPVVGCSRLLRLKGTLLKLLNTTVINWRQSTPQQSKPWDHCTVHTVTRTVCHSLTFSIPDHLIKTMNYFNLAEILLHPNLSLYPRLADVFLSDWYNKQFLDPCRGKRNVYLCTKPFSSEDVVVRLDICARGSKNLL